MRSFACEKWPLYGPQDFRLLRAEAQDTRKHGIGAEIIGGDVDGRTIETARRHAQLASLSQQIRFVRADVRDTAARDDRGLVLCNPPYGERLLDQKAAAQLARETGQTLRKRLPNWRVGMLSALEDFPKCYAQRPVLNRKLYNAKLKCYFYLFDAKREQDVRQRARREK